MRKSIIVFGAVVLSILMVSTATAVPQIQSKIVNEVEQKEIQLRERIETLIERINNNDPQPQGIISNLLLFLAKILSFLNKILSLLGPLSVIVGIIENIISSLEDLAAWIDGIINPPLFNFN
jgi:predicted PurR-regulated permease PerM